MTVATVVSGVAIAVAVLLGLLLKRTQSHNRRLLTRLEGASSDLQNLQMAFSRFAPDDVIERIIADGHADGGEKKRVTVLFADLVGFTALSEQVEPSVLLRILNGYFERMSQAITGENGYVSTLIGDGILALFGSITPNPWQENDAVRAALAMRSALDEYNAVLVDQGLPRLALGIGIHCGTGVAGLVGSTERREFAFIGRVVNVAARVQDLTRSHEGEIIVTDDVFEKLDPQFEARPLPTTPVKGVSEPVRIHAIEGFRKPASRAD